MKLVAQKFSLEMGVEGVRRALGAGWPVVNEEGP
jgi:hypothetical protein